MISIRFVTILVGARSSSRGLPEKSLRTSAMSERYTWKGALVSGLEADPQLASRSRGPDVGSAASTFLFVASCLSNRFASPANRVSTRQTVSHQHLHSPSNPFWSSLRAMKLQFPQDQPPNFPTLVRSSDRYVARSISAVYCIHTKKKHGLEDRQRASRKNILFTHILTDRSCARHSPST